MKHRSILVVFVLCSAAAIACEHRREIPAVGDASTTAATAPAPRGERALEPTADAAVAEPAPPSAERAPAEPAPPPEERARADERQRRLERSVQRAPLTIVQARDRDRNLGIVPAAPTRVEVDGGACEVGIEIKRAP